MSCWWLSNAKITAVHVSVNSMNVQNVMPIEKAQVMPKQNWSWDLKSPNHTAANLMHLTSPQLLFVTNFLSQWLQYEYNMHAHCELLTSIFTVHKLLTDVIYIRDPTCAQLN